jgi:hypothetical protein
MCRLLAEDAHLNLRKNPIDSNDAQELYKRCQDGILLWYVHIVLFIASCYLLFVV